MSGSIDFRASNIQTSKIIATGSTGTGARILVYPIDAQNSLNPNAGEINPAAFGTGSIGQDAFIFVSGAINSINSASHGAAVFGGDVYISGNLKVAGIEFDLDLLAGPNIDINYTPAGQIEISGTTPPSGWIVSGSTVYTSQSVIITGSGGLTGSLQEARPGVPYLLGGTYVTLVTNSLGQITIDTTGSGGGIAFTSWVKVNDMVTTGGSVVSNKVFRDSGSTMLLRATTDLTTIRVELRTLYPSASLTSGSTVHGQMTTNTDQDAYSGFINFTVSQVTSSMTATVYNDQGIAGETASFTVLLEAAPELTLVTLGTNGVTPATYPGAQTEFQSGDTVSVYWTADKPVYTIQVQAGNGFASQTVTGIGGATSGTFTATTNYTGTTQQKSYITIRAANAAGAYGAYLSSWPTSPTGGTEGLQWMYANNLAPSFIFDYITYPATQSALKDSETADIAVTASNFDTISYTSPVSEVSIPSSTTYSIVKTVTRIGGTYNISTNNYQIFATRAANNKSTTYQNVIKIATTTASLSISEPATRLRSGGNDSTTEQSHTITATFTQQMSGALHLSGTGVPSVSNSQFANSGWTTTTWAGGTVTFTRILKVHDNDSKGTYSWTTGSSLYYARNLANIETIVITGDSSYILGGFVSRDVSFPVFSQNGTINVAVTDYSKLTAGTWTASGNPSVKMATQGDQTDTVEGYTIGTSVGVGMNTNPATVRWNDSVRASTNADPGNLAKLQSLQETA